MATMNFNTTNSTFRQLLGNGLSYRVPPFQRDYSWTADEWDDLWQDIAGLFEADGEPAHYMGYLVLQSSDSKRFDIIDGQQRLKTISVMILAGLGHMQDLVSAKLDTDNDTKRFSDNQCGRRTLRHLGRAENRSRSTALGIGRLRNLAHRIWRLKGGLKNET